MKHRKDDLNNWSDNELMLYYSKCNVEGYSVLYERYKDKLYTYICKKLNDDNSAEDLFQDMFTRVCEHKTRYKDKAQLFTWLYKICRNLILNELWRRRRISFFDYVFMRYSHDGSIDTIEDILPAHNKSQDEELMIKEAKRIIAKEKARLSRRDQEVISLYETGFSSKEIAGLFGLTDDNVRAICSRFVRTMRVKLRYH